LIIEARLMTERNSHAAEELLEQYSAGSLPDREVARLEEHLLICDACQERLAFIDTWVRSLRRANAHLELAPPTFWERLAAVSRVPRWVPALGAALVLVATVGVSLKWNNRSTLAPVAVAIEATRGEAAAQVPAGRPLLIQPELAGLPQFPEYRLEIVNTVGKRMEQTTLAAVGQRPAVTVPGIGSGDYFVRLYSPAGELLREYMLKVGDSR
jgi:hypothetical protein